VICVDCNSEIFAGLQKCQECGYRTPTLLVDMQPDIPGWLGRLAKHVLASGKQYDLEREWRRAARIAPFTAGLQTLTAAALVAVGLTTPTENAASVGRWMPASILLMLVVIGLIGTLLGGRWLASVVTSVSAHKDIGIRWLAQLPEIRTMTTRNYTTWLVFLVLASYAFVSHPTTAGDVRTLGFVWGGFYLLMAAHGLTMFRTVFARLVAQVRTRLAEQELTPSAA